MNEIYAAVLVILALALLAEVYLRFRLWLRFYLLRRQLLRIEKKFGTNITPIFERLGEEVWEIVE